MDKRIRVLLVDGCQDSKVGLRTILGCAADVCVVGEAVNMPETLAQVLSLEPAVVLGNPKLQGMDLATLAATVRKKALRTRILVVADSSDEGFVQGMLRDGATGYVLKSETAEGIIEALRTVAQGEGWFSPGINAYVDSWKRSEGNWPIAPRLTEREREVLLLVARGKSNKEIALLLKVKERTVEFHMSNVLSKLGAHSRVQAAVWAKGQDVPK